MIAPPWGDALVALHQRYEDQPSTLPRTKEGRAVSRFRYHNAERHWMLVEIAPFIDTRYPNDALHLAGFVCQQALCAYLLDMGFTDDWNARHIKQDIAKALAYANACDLAHDCPDMARLVVVLSPYWKWRHHYDPWDEDRPGTVGLIPATIMLLVRALLDRVHDVTGHPRPDAYAHERQEARS